MSLVKNITSKHPELKRKLKIAHIDQTPEQYVKLRIRGAFVYSIGLSILAFMYIDRQNLPWILLPVAFVLFYFLFFSFLMHSVDASIARRKKQIDKEVLFAGRFLMIKLNTGQPLINALVDASKSYGVGSKYFREIVQDIELGTPLEESLEKAIDYTPSDKFQRILFQISNALKIGIDVTQFLENVLDEISNEQLLEIQRYAKKLNSITLFYMLMAIVIPSLGFTVIMVISSIVNLALGPSSFAIFLGALLMLQVMFLIIFKAARPQVAI